MSVTVVHNPVWKSKLGLLAIFLFATNVCAKNWRGIVPLTSTRTDVERKFGKPTRRTENSYDYYNLVNEIIVFRYQSHTCHESPGTYGYGWNVPPSTVIDIGVIPKGVHRSAEYLPAKSSAGESSRPIVYYSDEDAGLSVETLKGVVTLVAYYPGNDQQSLRCSRTEDGIVDIFPTFDEYGSISFSDQKARLDNFLIQMNNLSDRGVVAVYGGSPKIRQQLMKRAARAKDYLVKRRKLEPERLLIIDGGFAEQSYTSLSLYPIGGDVRIYSFDKRPD